MTQAVLFTGPEQVSFGTVDMPQPGPGEVQVRTVYSTVSAGTEGWVLRNLFTWAPTPYPCVPGYQRAGVVERIGEGVNHLSPGDRVVATVGRWQGEPRPHWGAHAALANTPAAEIYAMPQGLDLLEASGAVVAQVGYNAASRVELQPDDWCVVYGDGLIGQFAAQALRARGARVALVGRRRHRLKLAQEYSADYTLAAGPDAAARIREITRGSPVRAVLDTVQTVEAQREYLPLLQHADGQIVYCGFTPGDTWANMALLQQQELTTHFVSGWTRPRMEATLALMAQGALRLRPLLTHVERPSNAPRLYGAILSKEADTLGIALDWLA
ncbi:MAG: zinc-dependent alcohol dehydrogenase [Chthonomonadales bacterium]